MAIAGCSSGGARTAPAPGVTSIGEDPATPPQDAAAPAARPPEAPEVAEPARAQSPTVSAASGSAAACDDHRQHLREEYCDSDAEDEPCPADDLVCLQRLDLDSDGELESVFLTATRDGLTLVAVWTSGREQVIASAADPLDVVGTGESIPDFAWLVHWEVLERQRGGFFRKMIGRTVKLPITGADGDALMVSSGDAAAAVFLRGGEFVIEELGF